MSGCVKKIGVGAVCFLGAMLCHPVISFSQDSDIAASNISGDSENPRRHTRIKNTRSLDRNEATRIYSLIQGALNTGYTSSGLPKIDQYQRLPQFNNAPYRSSSHGNHYLNNYANQIGKDYGKFESSNALPVGTILYKDSFTVEKNRQIILGPLFLMEKMPAGFNKTSNDWKYTQVLPTGDILGETNGINSSSVDYCVNCHITRLDTDQLFYVPEKYRTSK